MTPSDGLRGAIAGSIGGLVGAAIKLACEAVVPPRSSDREPPPGVLASKLMRRFTGRELSKDQMQRAAMSTHWLFSTLSGTLHGIAVEARPALEASQGIPFGVVLWLGLHEITLPIFGATPPLQELPISEQINEFITHCAYGFSVERTRRTVRPLLNPI